MRIDIKFLTNYSFNTLRDVLVPGGGFLQNSLMLYKTGTAKWEASKLEEEYQESEAVSQTTSTTPVTKLSYNTGTLVGGAYEIEFYAEISNTKKANEVVARALLDGNLQGLTNFAPLDNGVANLTGDNYSAFSCKRRVVLTPGGHNLTIDYYQKSNNTALIRRARVGLRRIII